MMINGNPSVRASAAGGDVSTWSIQEMFPTVMLHKAHIGNHRIMLSHIGILW